MLWYSYNILHVSCHNLLNRWYLKVRHFILLDVGFRKSSPLTQTDAIISFILLANLYEKYNNTNTTDKLPNS